MTANPNADQVEYWNSAAGETWVRYQDQLDRQIAPLGRAAMRALSPVAGERILDIGCGCGQTSLELGVAVGAQGAVTGVDISQLMLGLARTRPLPSGAAAPVFVEADAQTAELGRFDAAFSRFGVMFFADPVAAFRNIRAALKPAGRIAFACWRPMAENIWMRAPLEAALPFLPEQPPADPLAPGPFAFADPERLRGILGEAGFKDVSIAPHDDMIGSGGIEASVELALRVGPLARALREAPEVGAVLDAPMRAALARYLTPEGVVRMPAAIWVVTAGK